MDATLDALYNIILRGLPTFFLVLLLHFYLKSTFFQPMARLLKERYDATEGAQKAAEAALARAEAKSLEYEAALRAARHEVFKKNEDRRAAISAELSARLAEARQHAETRVAEAKASIAGEVAEARQSLFAETDRVAETITESILRRTA